MHLRNSSLAGRVVGSEVVCVEGGADISTEGPLGGRFIGVGRVGEIPSHFQWDVTTLYRTEGVWKR